MALALPKFVLDTNIALYHLGNRLGKPLPSGIYFISIITEMTAISLEAILLANDIKLTKLNNLEVQSILLS